MFRKPAVSYFRLMYFNLYWYTFHSMRCNSQFSYVQFVSKWISEREVYWGLLAKVHLLMHGKHLCGVSASWTHCANEGGQCQCTGNVIYGRRYSGGHQCLHLYIRAFASKCNVTVGRPLMHVTGQPGAGDVRDGTQTMELSFITRQSTSTIECSNSVQQISVTLRQRSVHL